ncbi:hypothetical protein GCM10027515_14630 [Schumannella luteola]
MRPPPEPEVGAEIGAVASAESGLAATELAVRAEVRGLMLTRLSNVYYVASNQLITTNADVSEAAGSRSII